MKAVIVDKNSPLNLAFGERDEPKPLPSQLVVKVAAVSLNRGEVMLPAMLPQGASIGWDFAGTVEQAAADGSGPKVGTRVVGLSRLESWAERVAVAPAQVAELPDNVSFEDAATLPVAGLTAYHSLWQGGLLLGSKVLVTGATGGVGHFAVQLAQLCGARVTASVRRPEQEKIAREAGADNVAVGDDLAGAEQFGKYDLVVDGIGGKTLANSLGLLTKGGLAVTYGYAGGSEVPVNESPLIGAGGVRLYFLSSYTETEREPASIGLARLAALASAGKLKPLIDAVRPFSEILQAAQDLYDRKYAGKVVITLD